MSEKTYFNLYTSGLGYVNRVRTVTPKTRRTLFML